MADEEALGTWGAHWLLDHERDAVYADYVLTETGGFQLPSPGGPRLPVLVGEKGTYWTKITVGGTPGHGSQPYRTDNALITAAEVVRRIAEFQPPAQILDSWRQFVTGMGYDADLTAALLDPDRVAGTLPDLPLGQARLWHACTHTTFAPTVAHGGTKTNVIPDHVELQVDIRTLPGQTGAEAAALLREALGDLADAVEIESNDDGATGIAVDTPLWDSLARVERRAVQGLLAGADAHGHGHRQPVLPTRGRDRIRLRPVLEAPALRRLRHDVPRQRRARRPGVAVALDPALGGRRPRSRRVARALVG